MNMKLIKKNIIKIISILLLTTLFTTMVYAGKVENFSGNIASGAADGKTAIQKIVATVLNVVRTVGIAIAVVMLMVVACKYIMASAGDKADIKKYAVNYVIGALVLFGASGIVTILRNAILDEGSSGE